MVGASVISLVLFMWNVYAEMKCGMNTRYTPTSFSMVWSGASGSVSASTNCTMRVVGGHGEPVGVHLAQLGKALVPQLGVPGVVVAVGAEAHLHVELGHRGHPAAERLEQLHLGPLVVADATRGLLHVEQPGQLAPVPRRKRCSRLVRIGHGIPLRQRTC